MTNFYNLVNHFKINKTIFLAMKLSFILTLVVSLNVFAIGYSQIVNLNSDIRNTSIKEVLKTIETQSGFRFFYSDDFNVLDKKITLKAQDSDLKSILEQIFHDTPASVEYMEGGIVIITPFAQQGITITGTVTDAGEPLPGVNVSVKGTSIGVVSDVSGKYQITVPNTDAVLLFSFVGYATTEMSVGGQREINIQLAEDTRQIEEVVVVGYGTQKKVNLTGAVSAVKVDETLSSRAVQNVSTGLQGLLPGLAVSQNSAMAGRNDVSLMIRGMGTVNNANPLIVVDGMPDVDINRINMNDIESISVLKDAASSAVYGSRAANGVILVTTRTGKGSDKTSVNLSASYGWGMPTKSYEYMADYPRALTLQRNAAFTNTLEANQQFKKGTIDEWLALGMIDPLRYPNTDWWDIILRTSTTQNYNLSATGSSDRSNFFASIGVRDEKGLQINNNYTIYTARFNYDFKIKSNMNVGIRFSGNWWKYVYYLPDGFTEEDSTSGYDLQYAIAGITPYDPVSGLYGGVMAYGEDAQAYNPLTYMVNNLNRQNQQQVTPSMYFDWTLLKGLTARVDYTIDYYNTFRYTANMPNRSYNFQTDSWGSRVYVGDNAGVSNNTETGYKSKLSGRLNYDVTLAANHNISVMAAYDEEYWYQRWQSSSRNDRIHPLLSEIDAALSTIQGTGGRTETEGLRSFIGRINYTAFDKYLLEINLRADGSSKFLPGHQWGYFPSIAVGWRFTEENFIKSFTGEWLTHGKLRVSYGSLGNNSSVGRYEQQGTLTSLPYMIDNTAVRGFVNNKMINKNLSWESTTVANLGLDLGFLKNKLNVELDIYNKKTTDMIRPSQMSIHLTGGYATPRANIGTLRNQGVEANITWRDKKGKFSYMVNANASYFRNVLLEWNEFLDKGYIYVDMPYRFTYLYLDYGIAQTWQDIYDHTPQSASPGDILRQDVNGDGRIESNDKVAYPKNLRDRPTANFGLNANASWRGIDLAVMFTGAAGRKNFWLTNYNNVNPNSQRYAFTWDHWNNPWTWENRNGEWPRMNGNANREETAFWLDNMAYLRLKNIQLGYSLPKQWMNVLHIDNIRIFGTAENVATLTKFRGLDPERAGRGNSGGNASSVYPLVKSFSLGINVRF